MIRILGLGVALIAVGCATAPPRRAVESWPALPTDVAAAIVELDRHETFTLLVHPMAGPTKGELQCHWREGKLDSWEFVNTGAPGSQWWRLPVPPNSMGLGEPDTSIVERVVRVVDGQIDDRTQGESVPAGLAYHASFFCAQGELAAFSVGYVTGPLSGRGYKLILKRGGTGWVLSYVIPTWVA
jgi:hypothetical protein